MKLYLIVTEDNFGGAESNDLQVFKHKKDAENYRKALSKNVERSIYETDVVDNSQRQYNESTRLYVFATEDWFGGASTNDMKVFENKENAENYKRSFRENLATLVFETECQ